VLEEMTKCSLDLPLFLKAIRWDNPSLKADPKIQYTQTALMMSEELPGIIQHWHRPPRSHGAGVRTRAAC
ncbi:hypothetical protein K439DRAFT_1343440, partial [Ramaria rubella]